MTWVKIEDSLPDHERAIRAGDRAMWLWVAGLCWCSRHLSDGKIPREVVPRLTGAPDALKLASVLVEVGLWRETKAAFVVRNYGRFQRTRDEVDAERAATRKRVAKHREKRSGNAVTNGSETPPDTDTDTDTPQTPQGASDRESHGCSNGWVMSDDGYARSCDVCKPPPPLYAVGAS